MFHFCKCLFLFVVVYIIWWYYRLTPRGWCVTPSLLLVVCACGVGFHDVQLHRPELCCVTLWCPLHPLEDQRWG